jgi:DNA polymerase elongation subunit (family B)
LNVGKDSFARLNHIRGWLFDVYPSGPNKITVWIIAESGERVRLVDNYTQRIYISGNTADLETLSKKIVNSQSVAGQRFVEKHADFMEAKKKKVLEVDIADYRRTPFFARKILRLGGYERFQLHNVDASISQYYLYEKDIFPLAHVVVVNTGERLSYVLLDSVEKVDYEVPPLRSAWLNVTAKKRGPFQQFTDEIETITLKFENTLMVIETGNEKEKILELVETVKKGDPDLVYTHGGDSFLFPYLAYRAFVNGVLDDFVLSRDNIPVRARKGKGRAFFSYGRVYHKAASRRLYGRIHIDVDNTFIYTACGLEGLIEVSRTCRVPLHTASRASIGSIMSSLQLYTAWKDEILIPWKKREPETFKSAWELLVADRGGFVFEPKVGFHTDVFEVDFTSMFPMLMLKNNISAETVLCKCCPNSKLKVPELDYNICEKRQGIVPKTLEILLKKRLKYKSLLKEAHDEKSKYVYNMRQGALKWILVTCFGYLGYRNARFGKVDAHISVCAFARDALLKTVRMAEERGFEVIHGIVDSLWLKKPRASLKEVVELCRQVSKTIGIPLNVEGKYRWIVFLPSKVLPGVPVLNRYYGVFENGRIKMRGIEARRSDTPPFISKAQIDMINKLAKASNLESFNEKIPEALSVLAEYANTLVKKQVEISELLVAKRLSKSPSLYAHNVFQAIAARQLEKVGFEVHPGQTIRYVILDAKHKRIERRILASPLLTANTKPDTREYLNMLISAADTLLGVFGYTKDKIQDKILSNEKQLELSY